MILMIKRIVKSFDIKTTICFRKPAYEPCCIVIFFTSLEYISPWLFCILRPHSIDTLYIRLGASDEDPEFFSPDPDPAQLKKKSGSGSGSGSDSGSDLKSK